MSGWQSGSQRTMSSNKKRLNLSFSMASPIQRQAWKRLMDIPAGKRTEHVCRMICEHREQRELLDAVRQAISQELQGSQIQITQAAPQAGSIDEDVLGFLASLQEGDDTT